MIRMRLVAAVAAALAFVPGVAQAQDDEQQATIVIRWEPSLMALTRDALNSLVSSRSLAALTNASGARAVAGFAFDSPQQPPGAYVNTLVVRTETIEGENHEPSATDPELLDKVARILEEKLRARLEKAPLDRLNKQRDALLERLQQIAARRRTAITAAELAAQRERLDQERLQCAEEIARRELELTSESTVHQRFEDEIERLSILVQAGREPSSSLDRVKSELAQVAARIQGTLTAVDMAKKRLADCEERQKQIHAANQSAEDGNLLAAEFDRVNQALARVEERIDSFRPFEFEIWR